MFQLTCRSDRLGSSRTEIHSFTGTLIKDRFRSVARAQQTAGSRSGKSLSFQAAEEIKTEPLAGQITARRPRNSETEKLPQTLGLSAADWNLALLLIVHAQLVGTLEPGHDFANSINVHQVRAVGAPEQSRIQARE